MSILKWSNLILNSVHLHKKTLIPSVSVFQRSITNKVELPPSKSIQQEPLKDVGEPVRSKAQKKVEEIYQKDRLRIKVKLESESETPTTRSYAVHYPPLNQLQELPPNIQEIIKPFLDLGYPCVDGSKYMPKLHFYSDILPPLDDIYKTSDNKVELKSERTSVWIRAYLDPDDKVWFQADSDHLLAKGFASILFKGLSGRPVTELNPDFFTLLHQTLGEFPFLSDFTCFFNMLQFMQKRCSLLAASSKSETPPTRSVSTAEECKEHNDVNDDEERKWRIKEKLETLLRPVELEMEEHSHFNVRIVSKEFEGKTVAQRHRIIYALLKDELPLNLSIVAKAPPKPF